ncbi:hypothetical protein [Pseudoalteromonas simplex]|uniref:hypothetical protein n=1 Tax=Pseudoalteromonas simplex TaxID=2783613 RepID=UPI001887CE72|nr:hypothetical protein [Pseudoalteromonas sp. A520]
MEYIFITSFLLGIAYFLYMNRVTIFLFFFLCLAIYFMPLFFGFVNEPIGRFVEQRAIVEPLYIFAIFLFILCVIFDLLLKVIKSNFERRSKVTTHKNVTENHNNLCVFTFIVCFSFAMQLIDGGSALFSAVKADVLEASSRWTILSVISSMLAICYSLQVKTDKNNKLINILLVASLISLIFNIYIGHRSNSAILFLAVSYMYLDNKSIKSILKLYRYRLIAFLFLGLFFFVYKYLYIAIKLGDWDLVFSKLTSEGFFSQVFMYSEPFVTQGIFNGVLRENFITECTNMIFSPFLVIPGTEMLIDYSSCKYNTQLQNFLYTSVDYGVGSNLWAEFYSLSGFLSLYSMTIFYFFIVLLTALILGNINSPLLKSVIFILIAYMCFYANRKDLFLLLGIFKRVIYTALIVYFFSELIRFVKSVGR